MIDLGAHGMYLADWFLGEPKTYSSTFTLACPIEKNADGLEDNAVTVMGYENGAVAVNETGFVSVGCPETLEVGGDKGYAVYRRGFGVTKATAETGKKPVDVELLPALPSPLESFLQGESPADCGIEAAIRLTRMMEGAYANR
jgi:predicted dehydrogenase